MDSDKMTYPRDREAMAAEVADKLIKEIFAYEFGGPKRGDELRELIVKRTTKDLMAANSAGYAEGLRDAAKVCHEWSGEGVRYAKWQEVAEAILALLPKAVKDV